jgi:hypothetical protein
MTKIIEQKKHRNVLPEVSRWEWDFSECKNAELRDCYFYEWMREFPTVRRKVDFWRKASKGSKFDDWERVYSRLDDQGRPPVFPYELFNFCPEWPEEPYLSIPAKVRISRRKRLHQPLPFNHKSRGLEPVNIAFFIRDQIEKRFEPSINSLERGVVRTDGYHEVVGFKIEWRHKISTILNCFENWLRDFSPEDIKPWELRGNGSTSGQMKKESKALGAWRLTDKEHFGLNLAQAQRFTIKHKDGKEYEPIFATKESWSRAVKLIKDTKKKFCGSKYLNVDSPEKIFM